MRGAIWRKLTAVLQDENHCRSTRLACMPTGGCSASTERYFANAKKCAARGQELGQQNLSVYVPIDYARVVIAADAS